MHVFVSHAPSDRDTAARLRADLAGMGRQVALDRGEPSSPQWWDGVLRRIQRCDTFIFVLSPASMQSPGCMAEVRYARALRRPVLVVRAYPMPVPPELADSDLFDPAAAGADRARVLRAALNTLPATPPLPEPMPVPPLVPYLDGYRDQLDQAGLDRSAQHEMLGELRRRLRDDTERAQVWGLLVRLRGRPDVAPGVAEELEKLLAPGWRPDPEGRVERRYWDGQAWTTLVRHDGREFNERRVPPPDATWSGTGPIPIKVPKPSPTRAAAAAASAPLKPINRAVLYTAVGVVLAAGIGVTAFLMLNTEESAAGSPIRTTARSFVDAVTVEDSAALQALTCDKDRARADQLFLAGGFQLTLESLDADSDPPTFTVLATDVASGRVDRRTYPLVNEGGEWRVCSLS